MSDVTGYLIPQLSPKVRERAYNSRSQLFNWHPLLSIIIAHTTSGLSKHLSAPRLGWSKRDFSYCVGSCEGSFNEKRSVREEKSLRHVVMVAKFLDDNKSKTSLKKWVQTVSNFIDLIQFLLICQMFAKFSGVECETPVSKIWLLSPSR